MGKATKPLAVLIHPDIAAWPEWDVLREKGHEITVLPDEDYIAKYDIIMGPSSWRMTEALRPYLAMALEAAKVTRYGKGKKHAKPVE